MQHLDSFAMDKSEYGNKGVSFAAVGEVFFNKKCLKILDIGPFWTCWLDNKCASFLIGLERGQLMQMLNIFSNGIFMMHFQT